MDRLELRGVAVGHDGDVVLRGVDLAVAPGEAVVLLGRSGSGKTTLLRAVAGHDPIVEGRLLLGGRDVTDLPPRDRGVGMVAQGAPLQPTRDVEGNLRLPSDLRGEDPTEGRRRAVGEALRFGLRRLLSRRPHELSDGQRTAAALARSVVGAPDVLLLDEPTASLDHQTRAQVLDQLASVQRERGTTLLVATNQLAVARGFADRVAVLGDGRLVALGALHQVRASPATLDVADLVHDLPVARLDAQAVPGTAGGPTRLVTPAGHLTTWHTGVEPGPVVLGLPAVDLTLVDPPHPGAAAGTHRGLVGEVVRTAPTGAGRVVTVATDAGTVTVRIPGDAAVPRSGTRTGIAAARVLVATPDGRVLAAVERP